MDLDLSRLTAGQSWPASIDRTSAAVADGTVGPIVALLADSTTGAGIVRLLAESGSLHDLARDLEASAEGQNLTRLLATPAYGRQLVGSVVAGQAAADLARIITGDPKGDSPLGTMVGTDTRVARAWARSLVNSGPVRSRAKDTVAEPAARGRAQALLEGAAGLRLARYLGRDDSGRSLVRYLANAPAAVSMAVALTDRRADAAFTRALAASPSVRELTEAVIGATDGHRLVWDLLSQGAGHAIRLGLTETPRGRELLEHLVADEEGESLRAALTAADAGELIFADEVAAAVALVRIVVAIVLLLVLIIEPLALGALALLVAGVTAADLPTVDAANGSSDALADAADPAGAADADAIATDPADIGTGATGPQATEIDDGRLRVTIDVGPQAGLDELSRLLADVDELAELSGGLQVAELRYANPLEIVLVGAAAITAMVSLIKLPAELRKLRADTAEAKVDTIGKLIDILDGPNRDLAAELIARRGTVASIERLAGYQIEVDVDGPAGGRAGGRAEDRVGLVPETASGRRG